MKTQKSLKVNFVYNFLLTGMNLIYPLIISPYVSRMLGASNLGAVNFANTIVTWFTLFSAFGTMFYGVKEVAKCRDDREKLSKLFSELMFLKIVLTAITVAAYLICVFSIPRLKEQYVLFLVMGIILVLNVFALDWFYQGIEEYRYVAIRTLVLKAISFICIIMFVRHADNYIVYGLITALTLGISNLVNYLYSRKFVDFSFKHNHFLYHIRGLWVFFLYTFVVNLYTQFDQILLGFIHGSDAYVSYLYKAKSVYGFGVAITASVSNVIMPRAAYYINVNKRKYLSLIRKSYESLWFISIPMVVGAATLPVEILLILGGPEFVVAAPLIVVTSVNILLSAINSWYQHQVMVPRGDEKTAVASTTIVGIMSIILNLILIPYFGYIGAGIVSVISEAMVFLLKYVYSRVILGYERYSIFTKKIMNYILAGTFMGISIFLIKLLKLSPFLTFALAGAVGASVYAVMLIILKDQMIFDAVKFVKKKLKLKK